MRSLNTVTDEGNLGSIIFNFTEISRNHPAWTILLSTRRNASRFTKAFQLFEDRARRIENAKKFLVGLRFVVKLNILFLCWRRATEKTQCRGAKFVLVAHEFNSSEDVVGETTSL